VENKMNLLKRWECIKVVFYRRKDEASNQIY